VGRRSTASPTSSSPPQATAGPDFYFLTDVSDIANALAQLQRVLLGASLVLIALGGLAGWRTAHLAGSLADSVDALTAARDRERRFVADVSHELRTPVTALVHEAAELVDADRRAAARAGAGRRAARRRRPPAA
jgi:signal transduction histidine kinase